MQASRVGTEGCWPRHPSLGSLWVPLSVDALSLLCRFWNVPGMLSMKWVFLSGFGTLLAIITKTGALHMAGKPGLCSAVELEYNFLSKTHSCFITLQKNPHHMALKCVGFCTVSKKRPKKKKITKTKQKKPTTQNDVVSCCQEKLCVWPLFLPGSTWLKTTTVLVKRGCLQDEDSLCPQPRAALIAVFLDNALFAFC